MADTVLSEVRRVLRPGGYLGLDTPNARVTRLQQAEFIDPDHEHEYTDAEMRAKLTAAGFEVVGAWGLNHAGPSLAAGRFEADQVATARGPVPPDRGLLPPGLPVPGAGLTERPAWEPRPGGAGESGAGERTRTSTPSRGPGPKPGASANSATPAAVPRCG